MVKRSWHKAGLVILEDHHGHDREILTPAQARVFAETLIKSADAAEEQRNLRSRCWSAENAVLRTATEDVSDAGGKEEPRG